MEPGGGAGSLIGDGARRIADWARGIASFAAGRIAQLEIWALALTWKGVLSLLDVGLRGGLIKGDRLLDFFHGQCAAGQFSELPLPFAAVATDLASGEEIWMRDGKVWDAVRASCTVPGLFRPVLHNGRYLVDGSIANPVPVRSVAPWARM